MEVSKFPIWKKWNGLGSETEETIVMFTSLHEAKIWENGKLQELYSDDSWVSCDSFLWTTIEAPADYEVQQLIKQIFMNCKEHDDEMDVLKYSLDIQNERENDYGNANESFKSIAEFWSTYLSRKTKRKVKLDEIDVAQMMELFKINRNAYKRKEDNMVDGESYANFAKTFYNESIS